MKGRLHWRNPDEAGLLFKTLFDIFKGLASEGKACKTSIRLRTF